MAAATAAQTLRRLGHTGAVTMLCGEGLPPYSRPALMYALMGHVRPRETALHSDAVWRSLGVNLVADRATSLDVGARRVTLARGEALDFDRLLVATGSAARRLGVPGEDLTGVVQFWGVHDLAPIVRAADAAKDAAAEAGEAARAVVIGGGLSGIELCECLSYLGLRVTLVVREDRLMGRALAPEESDRALAALGQGGIEVRFETEVASIDADAATGRVAGVTFKKGGTMDCRVVGVTVGVAPDVAWLDGSGLEMGRGVRVDAALASGGAEGAVYAAGDCAELAATDTGDGRGGRIEQLWYSARAQGAVAAHGLAGSPRAYAPGVPFNSAKVFDTEWQAYGAYDTDAAAAGWTTHRFADARRGALLRVVAGEDGRVVAVSVMGARLRGETVRAWIADGRRADDVRTRLAEIAFDAEFDARRFVGV